MISTSLVRFSGIQLSMNPISRPEAPIVSIDTVKTTYSPIDGSPSAQTKPDELWLIRDLTDRGQDIRIKDNRIRTFMRWLTKGDGQTATKQQVFQALSELLGQLREAHQNIQPGSEPHARFLTQAAQNEASVAVQDYPPGIFQSAWHWLNNKARRTERSELSLGQLAKQSTSISFMPSAETSA